MNGAVTLTIDIDAAKPLALLRNGGRRMAYAVVNTLNAGAKAVQRDVRKEVARLTVRKTEFIMRQAAIIDPFASVAGQRYHARVRIGQKERLLLSTLETGGTRPSFGGGKRVAVPRTGGAARPTFSQPVPAQLRVTRLRLKKIRAGVSKSGHPAAAGKKPQVKGAQRSFVIDHSSRLPEGGIFQRFGADRGAIRLLYPYVRPPLLKKHLRWLETARRTAGEVLPLELRRQVGQAFARAFGVA